MDIRTQELLKHREEFMLQEYAKSLPFLTEDTHIYNSDASNKEVPRKQTSLHAALVAIQGLQDQNLRAMEEYNHFLACGEFPSISDSETSMEVAGIADACEDTEPETSIALQNYDDEDPDSDTSGSFKEEPERPPRQIRRKESKKRGGYI